MAKSYLDSTGLSHVWSKVKSGLNSKGSELTYEDGRIWLLDADGNKLGNGIDAAPFIKDGMLDDVTIVEASTDNAISYEGKSYTSGKFIKFIWNTDGSPKVDYLKVDEIGKTYTGSDSITIGSDNSLSVAEVDANITKTTRTMTVSSAIGDYAAGTEIPEGTDVMAILANIFEKTLGVTKTDPSVSLSKTSGKDAGTYEYGTKIDAVWNANFGAGSYAGNGWTMSDSQKASGVTASSYTWNNASGDSNVGTVAIPALTSSKTVEVVVAYGDGNVPVNNKGTEVPGSQIKGGTKKATKTYTAVKYWWIGSSADKFDDTTWTSDMVRALALANNVPVTTKTKTISFPKGAKQQVVAVPTGTTWSAKDAQGNNIRDTFSSTQTVNVLCGGTTEVEYTVYVAPANAGLAAASGATITLA